LDGCIQQHALARLREKSKEKAARKRRDCRKRHRKVDRRRAKGKKTAKQIALKGNFLGSSREKKLHRDIASAEMVRTGNFLERKRAKREAARLDLPARRS